MFALIRGDMGYGGEDISTVCCRSFDAVSVIDTTFASFVIDIEVLEVVVEINRAGAEVSAEKSSVGREDGSYVKLTFPAEGDGESCLPFVEMSDDSTFRFMNRKLITVQT